MKKQRLPKDIISILEFRIQQEEYSSRLYEQMSLWLNDVGFVNTSKVWLEYSKEELNHAEWAKSFLLDYGVMPKLMTLDAPDPSLLSFQNIVEESYEHEELVTEQVNELYRVALDKNHYQLLELARKYTAEQIEELGKLQTLLDVLDQFGTSKETLLILDSNIEKYT